MVTVTSTSKRTSDVPASTADNAKVGAVKRHRRGAVRESSPASTIADPNEQAEDIANIHVNTAQNSGASNLPPDTPDNDEGAGEALSYYEKNAFNKIVAAKFDTVSVLKQGNVITTIHLPDGQNVPGPFPVVLPLEVFPYEPETVTRLAHISAKDRIGVVKNISFLDDFADLRDNAFLCNAYGVQRLFTTGVVSFSALFPSADAKYPPKNKQLCVIPLAPLWERAKAVISKVFGNQPLFIGTYRSGVSFTSAWKPEAIGTGNGGVSVSSPAKNSKIVPAMLPFDSEIPIYDGRSKFTLQNYTQLPKKRSEIDPGSAVAVIFTTKKIENKENTSRVGVPIDIFKSSVVFYIQAVILLASPDNTDLNTTDFDIKSHAMGVDFVDSYKRFYAELPSEEMVEPQAGDEI